MVFEEHPYISTISKKLILINTCALTWKILPYKHDKVGPAPVSLGIMHMASLSDAAGQIKHKTIWSMIHLDAVKLVH